MEFPLPGIRAAPSGVRRRRRGALSSRALDTGVPRIVTRHARSKGATPNVRRVVREDAQEAARAVWGSRTAAFWA